MEVAYVGSTNIIYKSFPEHHHGYWEIIYNKIGSGTLYIDNQPYLFKPGSIAIIPPNAIHKKEAPEGFSDICLFIKNFRPIGKISSRVMEDDKNGTVCRLMAMAEQFPNVNNIYEHTILNAIGDLLYQVLVYIYINNQAKDIRVEGIMEEIINNFTDPDFNLSLCIEKSGYSERYFRKIFKESTGESPVNYMQNLRINYAKSLINQFGVSRNIKDIATSCGYKDPLYFSRVFKKTTGVSPKDYLKNQFHYDHLEITPEPLKNHENIRYENIYRDDMKA